MRNLSVNDWNNLIFFFFFFPLAYASASGNSLDSVGQLIEYMLLVRDFNSYVKHIYKGCLQSRLHVSLVSTVKYDKWLAYLIYLEEISLMSVVLHKDGSVTVQELLWCLKNTIAWIIVKERCFPGPQEAASSIWNCRQSFRRVTGTMWMLFFSVGIICFVSECRLKAWLKCYTCTALLIRIILAI